MIIGIVALLAVLFLRIIPASPTLVDGDTLLIRNRRWRLSGYDSPESDQPGGREATAHLRAILAEGRSLGIVVGLDVYRRPVVSVLTRRGLLSWRMISAGHAHATGPLGVVPMLAARLAGRGLWGSGVPVVRPSRWRRDHPRSYGTPARQARRPRLRFDYDSRKGLRLPGGFRLP